MEGNLMRNEENFAYLASHYLDFFFAISSAQWLPIKIYWGILQDANFGRKEICLTSTI